MYVDGANAAAVLDKFDRTAKAAAMDATRATVSTDMVDCPADSNEIDEEDVTVEVGGWRIEIEQLSLKMYDE